MTQIPDLSHLSYREKAEQILPLREVGYSDNVIAKILGWKDRKTVQNQLYRTLNKERAEIWNISYRQRVKAIRPRKPSSVALEKTIAFWIQVEDEVTAMWPTTSAAKIAHYLTEKYGRKVTRNAVIGKVDRWQLPAKKKWYSKRSEAHGREYPIRYTDAVARRATEAS